MSSFQKLWENIQLHKENHVSHDDKAMSAIRTGNGVDEKSTRRHTNVCRRHPIYSTIYFTKYFHKLILLRKSSPELEKDVHLFTTESRMLMAL